MNGRDKRVIEWLCSRGTGISSQTLCACFYGIPPEYNINYPHDPCDFMRCKRFLDLLTPEEKKAALQAAAQLSPQWKALVENWGRLEKMYNEHDQNMFKAMQKIIKEARQCLKT